MFLFWKNRWFKETGNINVSHQLYTDKTIRLCYRRNVLASWKGETKPLTAKIVDGAAVMSFMGFWRVIMKLKVGGSGILAAPKSSQKDRIPNSMLAVR